MDYTETKRARIIGARCTTQEELHRYLAKKLDFPTHYGANLSALADCISEIGEPTHITVAINEPDVEPGMQAYLLRLVQVLAREALVNSNVTLTIEHPGR